MDQDPARVNRSTYDQIAGQFAAHTQPMDGAMIARAGRLIHNLRPGDRVLELGCGPGRDLGWFEGRVGVVGADLSMGMLREARRRVTKAALCQMEMRQLGFAPGCFAGVWCNAALLHLPKKALPQALAEIARVLIPGGRFTFSMQQGSGEGLEAAPGGGAERFFARYAAEELSIILAAAGFRVLNQEAQDFFSRTWLWFETAWT